MRRSQFLNSSGLRKDGRRAHEIRRIRCKFGVSEDADGSVLYEQGLTRVLVLVHGPREAMFRRSKKEGEVSISCEYRTTPFNSSEHRERRRGMDRKSVDLAKTVKRSMEALCCVSISKIADSNLIVEFDLTVECYVLVSTRQRSLWSMRVFRWEITSLRVRRDTYKRIFSQIWITWNRLLGNRIYLSRYCQDRNALWCPDSNVN